MSDTMKNRILHTYSVKVAMQTDKVPKEQCRQHKQDMLKILTQTTYSEDMMSDIAGIDTWLR